ncbi:MAG TPA: ATP-dependent zinc metalloprotease FtsH [Saprospiraceae bacterium]|nr:ATP-dependent zinc metalloprotease FtsH [Saprospiraceae bacterium]
MLENKNNKDKNKDNKDPENKPKFNIYWIYALIAILFVSVSLFSNMNALTGKSIDSSEYQELIDNGEIEKITIINRETAHIYLKDEYLDQHNIDSDNNFVSNSPHFYYTIGSIDQFVEKLDELSDDDIKSNNVVYQFETRSNWMGEIMSWVIPLVIFIGIWLFIMRRMSGGAGGPGSQIFNIGKSKATLFDKDAKVNVTFEDVAGLEEAKEEVKEVVDFLQHPKKYTSLGGKIPKGVLLVGPPGTGKTLLAKAVAGEAGVPFFSISGSDFVEMFVGVGASRVRDLFKQAREKAPCIVFIDEIDAIGRTRGKGAVQGGNDERENTLNQLLVEMDGFSTDKGVILMAATNRPDVLDQALLRPGRFDRQIGIDLPDIVGREAIFKVHLQHIKVAEEVDAKILAEMTPGFAGADIANVCNEAALVAARRNKKQVEMDDFNYALDRVIGGLEKKNKIIAPQEKEIIAFHEAGHAICGWFLEYASPLVKVTIVPRGIGTLGYAQYLPKEEHITRTEQLLDRMCMTLGGRAAEDIIFGKISTGAQNDLDRVTRMAYNMIAVYGMNPNVGNVSFYKMSEESYQRPYSEETAKMIDEEVRKMIDIQYERAKSLLEEKREDLTKLAQELIEHEVLTKTDVERLLGLRPENKPVLTLKITSNQDKENDEGHNEEEVSSSAEQKAGKESDNVNV